MNKNTMILVVAALVIGLLVGFFVERQRATDKLEAVKLMMQNQFDAQKMANDKLTAENKTAMEKLQSITITPSPTSAMKKVVITPVPAKY